MAGFELNPTEAQVQAQTAQSGSALTANVTDLDGGLRQRSDQVQAQRQGIIEQQVEKQERSAGEEWGAVFDQGGTAYIARAFAREMDDTWDYVDIDPDYDPQVTVPAVIAAYGLEDTDEVLADLASARSQGELEFLAGEMARNEDNQRIVAEHGFKAFVGGMVDPTQLLVDMATLGTTRAYKLGRVATGVVGGAASTLPVGLADLAGRDASMSEYVLNAALGGGAFSLFGGEAANRIARGEANWFGRAYSSEVPAEAGTKGTFTGRVNEQTTEYDRLAMPTRTGAAERRDILSILGDDPVRRRNYLSNSNAPSEMRRNLNEMDGLRKIYEDNLDAALKQEGLGWATRRIDMSGRAGRTRDAIERDVMDEILLRDNFFQRYGGSRTPPRTDERIAKLADDIENIHNRMGEIARESGVKGFEDFVPRPGYVHRSWNAAAMHRYDSAAVRNLIAQAAMKGMPNLDQEAADLIAKSIFDRARATMEGTATDFLGTLGRADGSIIRELLEGAPGVSPARMESIMRHIDQNLDGKGKVKYAKDRLPLDMSVVQSMPDGSVLRMTDFLDNDISRLTENYVSSMSGRSALAKAGAGGGEGSLQALRTRYIRTLDDLPGDVREDRILTFDGLMSDFTGNRPAQNKLGTGAQRWKTLADAGMLAASGLWQIGEYATMAHRFGFVETNKEFLRQFPAVAGILRKAGRDPDLRDELSTVLNMDLARDIRVRQWTRQHDNNLRSSDTALDRALHAGKQAVPFLNGMKYVHKHQSRMNANLAINKIARAAKGDAKAKRMLEQYGLRGEELDRVMRAAGNATYKGKNATSMNWAAWNQADVDSAMNVALRMMDDSVLFGRAGQGVGTRLLGRSELGQVLGQFRSFVSFAHNKLLRGTLENSGATGVASLLVFQYPLMSMMVTANEARKGRLDLSEEGLREIAVGTIGYTAGLGFAADVAGVLGLGSRGGLSTPILGVVDALPRAASSVGKAAAGDFRGAAGDLGSAAQLGFPTFNLIPGTAAAINAIKE